MMFHKVSVPVAVVVVPTTTTTATINVATAVVGVVKGGCVCMFKIAIFLLIFVTKTNYSCNYFRLL